MKLKAISTSLSAILEIILADLTCEYGTNWKRPILLWFLFVLVVFPLVYYVLPFFGIETVSEMENKSLDFPSYLYFSIVTATTLGYGDFHPVGIGRIFASLEALTGMLMWAIFLVVFARKYMR